MKLFRKVDVGVDEKDRLKFTINGGKTQKDVQSIRVVKKHLDTDTCRALDSPVDLIEAPGPGKLIVPLVLMSYYTFGTVECTFSGNYRVFVGDTWADANMATFSWLNLMVGTQDRCIPFDFAANGFNYIPESLIPTNFNQPLKLQTDAPVTDGDGTLDITSIYYVFSK